MEVFAIILSAFIGGGFAIAAAFITRGEVIRKTSNPTYKLGGFIEKFVEFFSVFNASKVRCFEVKAESVYTEESLNITVVTSKHFKNEYLNIKFVLPDKKIIKFDSYIGSHKYFNLGDREYRIMLTDVKRHGYSNETGVFEIREIVTPV